MAKLIKPNSNFNWREVAPYAVVSSMIGIIVVIVTFAAATNGFEAENGALSGAAKIVTVAGNSGTGAVQFGGSSTPSPTPTPAPTGFQTYCINSPHTCGYPDSTNTGVPGGTTLYNSTSVTVTTDGAVVQNLNINGHITVHANNVTIKNTRVTSGDYYPIDYGNDGQYSGLLIEDSEIVGNNGTIPTAAVSFSNYTALRLNVHGTVDGFKANSNATIQDSYIHELAVGSGTHNDAVQSTGGSNVTFKHNTCDTRDGTDCIQFGASDSGWVVANNLVNTSGWMFNGSTGTVNSTFLNNRFTRFPGGYGPASIPGAGITWAGNYFDDTGAPVTSH